MDGFDAGETPLPTPPIGVADETRARLSRTVYAMIAGHTPEEIAGFLEDAFPPQIEDALDRAGEREEMHAHIDVILSILQAPAAQPA